MNICFNLKGDLFRHPGDFSAEHWLSTPYLPPSTLPSSKTTSQSSLLLVSSLDNLILQGGRGQGRHGGRPTEKRGGCHLTPLPSAPPSSPQFFFSLHPLVFPLLRGMGRGMREWRPADTKVVSCQSNTLGTGRATVSGRKGRSCTEGEWWRRRWGGLTGEGLGTIGNSDCCRRCTSSDFSLPTLASLPPDKCSPSPPSPNHSSRHSHSKSPPYPPNHFPSQTVCRPSCCTCLQIPILLSLSLPPSHLPSYGRGLIAMGEILCRFSQ